MTQILSTFSHAEQARFAAFQQSQLSLPAIEAWVDACLRHRYGINDDRPLTQPGVPLVVASLAKTFAQRQVQQALTKKGIVTAETLRDGSSERGFWWETANGGLDAEHVQRREEVYQLQQEQQP